MSGSAVPFLRSTTSCPRSCSRSSQRLVLVPQQAFLSRAHEDERRAWRNAHPSRLRTHHPHSWDDLCRCQPSLSPPDVAVHALLVSTDVGVHALLLSTDVGVHALLVSIDVAPHGALNPQPCPSPREPPYEVGPPHSWDGLGRCQPPLSPPHAPHGALNPQSPPSPREPHTHSWDGLGRCQPPLSPPGCDRCRCRSHSPSCTPAWDSCRCGSDSPSCTPAWDSCRCGSDSPSCTPAWDNCRCRSYSPLCTPAWDNCPCRRYSHACTPAWDSCRLRSYNRSGKNLSKQLLRADPSCRPTQGRGDRRTSMILRMSPSSFSTETWTANLMCSQQTPTPTNTKMKRRIVYSSLSNFERVNFNVLHKSFRTTTVTDNLLDELAEPFRCRRTRKLYFPQRHFSSQNALEPEQRVSSPAE